MRLSHFKDDYQCLFPLLFFACLHRRRAILAFICSLVGIHLMNINSNIHSPSHSVLVFYRLLRQISGSLAAKRSAVFRSYTCLLCNEIGETEAKTIWLNNG